LQAAPARVKARLVYVLAVAARVHLLISGLVQGVGFRWASQREATRLGLVGWVRNRADGRVEAVAEGPEEAVEAFLAWCERGPAGAAVDAVACERQPPQGRSGRFTIER
jgi:acylphosphatase